ncbi:MAG TPA: Fur family transcriptional regulator [Anaerolineae bacterium]|nr:Fur family transcriptional regulator [Anaerolineae bacterium]
MTHFNVNYAALMRKRGFRVTPQRQVILDAICEGGGHTTPEEIYRRVHAKAPAINRATVYRTLDFLCELHLVVAMRVGDQAYYEIAGETPHHHLVCRACGAMIALDNALLEGLVASIDKKHHFYVDMDHVGLFGLCEDCRRAESQRKS